jgi:hypothetical protein
MGRIAFIMVSKEFPPPANPLPEGGQVMLAVHQASFE